MEERSDPFRPTNGAPRYNLEFALVLVRRILVKLADADFRVETDVSNGKGMVRLVGDEAFYELALESVDGTFSPDAVRATAALLLRYSGNDHAKVQAMYYPLPADGNEEEEV